MKAFNETLETVRHWDRRFLRKLAVLAAAMLFAPAFAQAGIIHKSSSNAMTGPDAGNAARTLTIARPADVAAGDFLLAQITYEYGSGINFTSIPAGWTLLERTDRYSDFGQAIFYKAATATDVEETTSYQWRFSQPVKGAGGILCYEGVSLGDAGISVIDHTGNAGDSATLTAPGVNAQDGSMLVAFFGIKKSATTLSVPAGMEEVYTFKNPQNVHILAAAEVRVLDGATGDRISSSRKGTSSVSDKWVAQCVALRPAPLLITDPNPIILTLTREADHLLLSWTGGLPPYQVKVANDLINPEWKDVGGPISANSMILSPDNGAAFYRVQGQ